MRRIEDIFIRKATFGNLGCKLEVTYTIDGRLESAVVVGPGYASEWSYVQLISFVQEILIKRHMNNAPKQRKIGG